MLLLFSIGNSAVERIGCQIAKLFIFLLSWLMVRP